MSGHTNDGERWVEKEVLLVEEWPCVPLITHPLGLASPLWPGLPIVRDNKWVGFTFCVTMSKAKKKMPPLLKFRILYHAAYDYELHIQINFFYCGVSRSSFFSVFQFWVMHGALVEFVGNTLSVWCFVWEMLVFLFAIWTGVHIGHPGKKFWVGGHLPSLFIVCLCIFFSPY